jgi:hypothetical protein
MEKGPLIVDADEASAPAGEIVADVGVPRRIAVRETSRLYRLRSARFVALVAADTEEEAREMAARQDMFGGNWRDPAVATAEFEDTGESHVFGDVTIAAASPPPRQPRQRKPSA